MPMLTRRAFSPNTRHRCSRLLCLQIVRRVRETLSYIDQLDPETHFIVHSAYEHALQATFGFCVLLSVAAFVSSLWIKEKPLLSS
jgi:hypothetical protein